MGDGGWGMSRREEEAMPHKWNDTCVWVADRACRGQTIRRPQITSPLLRQGRREVTACGIDCHRSDGPGGWRILDVSGSAPGSVRLLPMIPAHYLPTCNKRETLAEKPTQSSKGAREPRPSSNAISQTRDATVAQKPGTKAWTSRDPSNDPSRGCPPRNTPRAVRTGDGGRTAGRARCLAPGPTLAATALTLG